MTKVKIMLEFLIESMVPRTGLEPVSLAAADFKSAVYTSFTTRAGGGLSHRWMLAHSVLLSRENN